MSVSAGPNIIEDNLSFAVDASNVLSYPNSGTTWLNQVSNNHGSFAGSPTFSNGTNQFNGATWVTFQDEPSLRFKDRAPMTYEAWCKPTTAWPNTSWRGLIDKENNPGSGRAGYTMWLHHNPDTGLYRFGFERFVAGAVKVGQFDTTDSSTILNKFHHIVGTYDGNNVRIYQNGILKDTEADDRNVEDESIAIAVAFRRATYGQSGSTSSNAFIGSVPIARIYTKALSASEIIQNYNALKGRFGL